jgi:nucleoside-diphosphate-sugar epimerase
VNALITGATGFIGGALANALLQAGWQVSVLIRPGSRSRLSDPGQFQIVEADLGKPEGLAPALEGLHPDVIVHAAAIRNRWGTPPDAYYTVNVAATQTLLDMFSGQAKRFVYVSSVGVFGRPGVLGIDESFPIQVTSTWDYHSSKVAGEKITLTQAERIEVVVVRPTITYGPGDRDGMLTRLIEMVAQKRFLRIGQGENHVHLTYIQDLVDGLQLTMTHPNAPGNTYILAGPHPIKIKALLALIEEQTHQQLPRWYLPQASARKVGAVCETIFQWLPKSWAPPITRDKVDNLCANRGFSSAKATQELGYQPQWSYETGLQQAFEWFKIYGPKSAFDRAS